MVLAFHVEKSDIEDVDVSDLSVVVVADTPQQTTDGNWRVGLFMDERAVGYANPFVMLVRRIRGSVR